MACMAYWIIECKQCLSVTYDTFDRIDLNNLAIADVIDPQSIKSLIHGFGIILWTLITLIGWLNQNEINMHKQFT